MKVVLVRSYSTNKDSATTRPAVLHNGHYYALGDVNTPGALRMMRYSITHRLSHKQYPFLSKDSYVQPGFTVPAHKAHAIRVLGEFPKSLGNIIQDKIKRYNSFGLPVKELA